VIGLVVCRIRNTTFDTDTGKHARCKPRIDASRIDETW